jgi:hypothetical protein
VLGWLADRFSPADEAAGPLGSPKGARTLLAELEAETPRRTVQELARHLKDTPCEVLTTPRGISALQTIDESAQRPLAELWTSLLGDSQGMTVTEAVWDILTQYYRRSFLAYWNCHRAQTTSEAVPKQDQSTAIILAARAVAAAAKYTLVLRLRYITPPKETWSHLWRLISWSDKRGNATEQVELYSGTAPTTIEHELVTAMLIEVSPSQGLLPGQMLALDRLLRVYGRHYQRSDRHDGSSTPFAYDPSRGEPPERWLEGLRMRPELRFFGLASAQAELCKALAEAKSHRNLPAWLSQTRCSAESYVQLLDRIVAEFSPDPPRRRHQREVCSGEILVARDWGDIRRLLKFSELALSGRSLAYDTGHGYNMNGVMATALSKPHGARSVASKEALSNLIVFERMLDAAAIETWSLRDTSESGIGATAEKDCAWIRVGMIIAFRHCESAEWRTARVRRLERSASGSLVIGMARIMGKVSSARLRPGIGRIDYTSGPARSDPAIEYDAVLVRDTASAVLLPSGLFDPTQKYTLTCEEQHRIVKMERSLERGPNFERIEISEVEMQCAA